MSNRMIRVSIGIADEFSNIQVPGVNLALYNSSDALIRTWTTSGSVKTMEGLEPGSYYLIKDAETETHYDVQIQDTAEIQVINIHTSYYLYYLIIGAAAALGLGIILLVILLIRRRRKKQKANG